MSIHRFIVDTETAVPAKLAIDASGDRATKARPPESGAARGDFWRDIVATVANARWAAKTAIADKDKAPFNG